MPSAFSHSTWKFRFPPFLITEFSESTFSFTEISRGFSVHTEFSRSTFSQNRNFRDPPFLTQKFRWNLPSLTCRNFWGPLFLIQNFLYPPSPILEISKDSLCLFWHPRQNLVFCLIPHTTQNRPGPLFVNPLFVFFINTQSLSKSEAFSGRCSLLCRIFFFYHFFNRNFVSFPGPTNQLVSYLILYTYKIHLVLYGTYQHHFRLSHFPLTQGWFHSLVKIESDTVYFTFVKSPSNLWSVFEDWHFFFVTIKYMFHTYFLGSRQTLFLSQLGMSLYPIYPQFIGFPHFWVSP